MTTEFWVGPPTAPDTYELVEMLGGGGEGEVWGANLPLSTQGRSRVAVKILPATGAAEEEQAWTTFGQMLGSLSHPGLVRVRDMFCGPAMHRRGEAAAGSTARYVVMDYVAGPTLREWTDEHPDATAAVRLRMLRAAASALDEMHRGTATEVPVAHGDVKPANIIVRESGATVLVDLGLARLVDSPGQSGRSSPYAAPELRGPGPQATPEADRWAFAVTAAQILTGQPPPVDRQGFLDPIALTAQLRASPVTQRRPILVRRILDVLQAPPEARPRALRPWLDGAADTLSQATGPGPDGQASAAVPTRPPTPSHDPGAEPVRVRDRRRGPLLIALASVVVLLAGGAVAWSQNLITITPAGVASPITTATRTPVTTEAPPGTTAAATASHDAGTATHSAPAAESAGSYPDSRAAAPEPTVVADTGPAGQQVGPTTPAGPAVPAAVPAVVAAAPAAPGDAARPYVIKGYGGNCLDVQGPSTADGTPVQMWGCNGAGEMTWQVVGDEIHGYGGKCLDVRGPSAVNGTPVQVWDCNGAEEMKWQVVGAEIQGFGGKCLDVRGPSTADGTPVQLWDCNGVAEQLWSLQRA